MLHDGLDEPLSDPLTAVRFEDEHVAQPGERGVVRDYASKPDLTAALVCAKTEGVLDRRAHLLDRAALSPVRGATEEVVDEPNVEARLVRTDRAVCVRVLLHRVPPGIV